MIAPSRRSPKTPSRMRTRPLVGRHSSRRSTRAGAPTKERRSGIRWSDPLLRVGVDRATAGSIRTRSWTGMTFVVLLLTVGLLFIETFGFVEVTVCRGDRLIGDLRVVGGLL